MFIKEKRRNSRNTAMMLDFLHILVGVLEVACAVLVFLNPEGNRILFPVIFGLAFMLNGVNGWCKLRDGGSHDKKKRLGGIAQCAAALVLLAVGVVSAMSIWR